MYAAPEPARANMSARLTEAHYSTLKGAVYRKKLNKNNY